LTTIPSLQIFRAARLFWDGYDPEDEDPKEIPTSFLTTASSSSAAVVGQEKVEVVCVLCGSVEVRLGQGLVGLQGEILEGAMKAMPTEGEIQGFCEELSKAGVKPRDGLRITANQLKIELGGQEEDFVSWILTEYRNSEIRDESVEDVDVAESGVMRLQMDEEALSELVEKYLYARHPIGLGLGLG